MQKLLNRYFSTVKKFLPEGEKGFSVGLDIGVNACKMVELGRSSSSYEIVNWAIEPIPQNDVKSCVRRILSKFKTPPKNVHTAVFGKGTLIRFIDVPRMSLEDLKKSLSLEADKYFPFARDQIYTDCFIIDPKGKENKMSVLFAASKKELIDERIKLLNELSLPADYVGLNSIAVSNLFQFSNEHNIQSKQNTADEISSSAVAILDIGGNVSNLMITIGNTPRFTRDIYIGSQEFCKRIINALGVSFEEAERIMCDPKEKKEEVLNAIESAILNLITEIRLSLDYFTTEYNFYITKILLTGGSSLLNGIEDLFAKNLDIKVERWQPINAFQLSGSVDAKATEQNFSRLTVALGLGLTAAN